MPQVFKRDISEETLMPDLLNPFSPFITALASAHHGNAHIQGPMFEAAGSVHNLGTIQLLQDEFGKHVGTINHLTGGFATLTDRMGASAGTAHTFAGTTEIIDRGGSPEAYIHHGVGGHDIIEDANHEVVGSVDHLGHVDTFHDSLNDVVQTVLHE
jgi:hypothetical protein